MRKFIAAVGAVAVVAFVSIDVDLNVPLNGLKDAMDASKPHGVSITIQ